MTQGYLLHLPTNRRTLFSEHISEREGFAQPVDKFPYNRSFPYLVFVEADDNVITHLAAGTGGSSAGSGLRRLNLKRIIKLTSPLAFSAIMRRCNPKLERALKNILRNGGPIPPKSFAEMLRCISLIDVNLDPLIKTYFSQASSFSDWNPISLQSLAYQKEALSTALHLSDIDRSPLQEWNADTDTKPANFLDGMKQVYLREDQMINSDLTIVPGFDYIQTTSYASSQFRSWDSQVVLDVIIANRNVLEEQTGADLIYYNETYRSFILVQYKAMEKGERGGAIYRLPNTQLEEEIRRMEALAVHLGEQKLSHHSHYRFTYNPFFIKLCPRIVLDPQSIELTRGMYFNLDHWKLLEQDDTLIGSQGGKIISFENVGRHITNSDFVVFVKHSWIGTTPVQSGILEKLIKEILETGKSVVYAVKRDNSLIKHVFENYTEEVENENDEADAASTDEDYPF